MAELKTFHKILIVIAVLFGIAKLATFKFPKFRNREAPVTQVREIVRTVRAPPEIKTVYVKVPAEPTPAVPNWQHTLAEPTPSVSAPVRDVPFYVQHSSGSVSVEDYPVASVDTVHIDSDAFDRYYRN
jgi:hypothetical protein